MMGKIRKMPWSVKCLFYKILMPLSLLTLFVTVSIRWSVNHPADGSERLLNWVIENRPRRDFSDSNNETGYDEYLVPNYVHFVRFGVPEVLFYEMLTIRAVHRNHRPDKIFIHTDSEDGFTGKYWEMVKDIPNLEVRHMPCPTHIFGKPLSHVWHASDVARLLILMTYGGIFLDNDSYVVRSLDRFRRFEFAIGWPAGEFLGTQVLLAHRDARFLKLWYESYRNYKPDIWYYNAGELPTTSVLYRRPELVHRVKEAFGVTDLCEMLYNNLTSEWRKYHAIHLMIRHRSYKFPGPAIKFDEENVRHYDRTFGEMARDLLEPLPPSKAT